VQVTCEPEDWITSCLPQNIIIVPYVARKTVADHAAHLLYFKINESVYISDTWVKSSPHGRYSEQHDVGMSRSWLTSRQIDKRHLPQLLSKSVIIFFVSYVAGL
jgi:hypothetical protein